MTEVAALDEVYLICAHCKCEFLPTARQAKRSRRTDWNGRAYCSNACQMASIPRRSATVIPFVGICRQCGKQFTSRYYKNKIFCTMKCYIASSEFRDHLRANAAKGSAARILKLTGELPKPKAEIACLNCGTKRIVKASEVATKKYCNRRCYREYMAGRFDRWIASPQSIALPQAYDEFLSQNELPCLIEGCGWVGKHLGNHVNFAHGISVEEFKRAAGFNKKTGLVTPAVATALSERPHIHDRPFGGQRGSRGRNLRPPVRNYRSLEGSEHQAKAMALLAVGPSTKPVRICQSCGREFQPGPLGHAAKYCSIPCRTAFYKANFKNTRFWLQCATCLKDFQGYLNQKRREERGLKVYCCPHCRQTNAGKLAGAARHQRHLDRIARL